MNIFTYGSLMYAPVWSRVVRGRYRALPAVLKGYRRLCVRGEPFPGLWPGAAEARVEGVLYLGILASDLARLDEFEGDYYHRHAVTCAVGQRTMAAAVYLFRPECQGLLTDKPWDPAEFERVGMRLFLNGYRGFSELQPDQ